MVRKECSKIVKHPDEPRPPNRPILEPIGNFRQGGPDEILYLCLARTKVPERDWISPAGFADDSARRFSSQRISFRERVGIRRAQCREEDLLAKCRSCHAPQSDSPTSRASACRRRINERGRGCMPITQSRRGPTPSTSTRGLRQRRATTRDNGRTSTGDERNERGATNGRGMQNNGVRATASVRRQKLRVQSLAIPRHRTLDKD